MRLATIAALAFVSAAGGSAAHAQAFDYRLEPKPVADGVFVVEGVREGFDRANGGNIVNTGFVLTPAGAVVIDTGPSRRYGEALRAAIGRRARGIAQVFVTHAHPDHFLGDQAFSGTRIAALPATIATINRSGDALAANLYRLVGGWMEGTEAVAPAVEVRPGTVDIGGRAFRLIALAGHTDGDLAILDERTHTLFAGDLAFLDRTPTTPNADLDRWLAALDALAALDVEVLVPGHGPVVHGKQAIAQTRAYLLWLRDTLAGAAAKGLDMNETMALPPPPDAARLAVFREEFERSVVHLYPAIEVGTLKTTVPP